MIWKYSGKDLDECLIKAEQELSISREELDYTVVSKKGFIKKKVEIEVHIQDEENDGIKNNAAEVEVDNEHIFLKTREDQEILIEVSEVLDIYVNDTKLTEDMKVTAKDKITYSIKEKEPTRELKVSISADEMEAKININYISAKQYKLICAIISDKLVFQFEVINEKFTPLYTKDEIRKELSNEAITYGIDERQLDVITQTRNVSEVLIAKGDPLIEDEEDKLDIKFEDNRKKFDDKSLTSVDYKNLYSIANVSKGDVLAEIVKGKEGHDGKNIKGKEIKRKTKKELKIKIEEGCIIKDGQIIATMEGRPTIKNGVFFVNKVYTIAEDVDIKTGNIDFVGDVCINGNIKSGMQVKSGNSVNVTGNVEEAKIIAEGQVNITGSVIHSELLVGGEDFAVKNYLDNLEKLKKDFENLMKGYEEVYERQFNNKISAGEIIKILLENKFKNIQKECMSILVSSVSSEENSIKIKNFIRRKIIGSGPLSIKYSSEVYDFINSIEIEMEPLKNEVIIPVDVFLDYSQESKISATGDIVIQGKGQYISDLCSKSNVVFEQPGAVARGGIIEAKKSIKAKTIGSIAGVTTTLKVAKEGVITADIAYQNTTFIFGERKYLLEVAAKDVKAYMNDKGEIIVEKFLL